MQSPKHVFEHPKDASLREDFAIDARESIESATGLKD